MPLTFTSVYPRRLVSAAARLTNADNWVAVPGCELLAWRPETILVSDFIQVVTTANMKLYKSAGVPHGYGRTVRGILWTRNSEAVEALVAASHLDPTLANAIDVANSLQLQAKFNTGLNTNNFRFVTKTFLPVAFGVGYGYGEFDWLRTLDRADGGRRGLFPAPFVVLLDQSNTHFNTADTNFATAGIVTQFSNT